MPIIYKEAKDNESVKKPRPFTEKDLFCKCKKLKNKKKKKIKIKS